MMVQHGAKPELGVCYYPEHWPESLWAEDARRMREAGIGWVRIGEFAWSRLEPEPGRLDFGWLHRAIDVLHAAGLRIVLGTPTATPPKWLVDSMPDMLPVDADGRVRGFGSRRHYCFSHAGYRAQCRRIVSALVREFGEHPGIGAWQTDNEYDCHNTTLSYSRAALEAFRDWLAQRYQSPDALNRAWGNVFWSMEVRSFDEVGLPNLTVTEANPAHRMDFRRFASEQVASFNRLQTDIIRKGSPGRTIIHNFMGRTLAFDHFDVGRDLDASSWDSYPIGFLGDRSDRDAAFRQRFMRAGDPDFQAFHHDLYRATSGGRWWVMEQQPGPVNWADFNPVPRDGMVRLWSLEAFAHGAEVVSYFRWRQAPFAQEQMHAGLLAPDSRPAQGLAEASSVAADLAALGPISTERASVAIVFDYPSAWAWEIQPQGRDFDYFRLVFDQYKALRSLGMSVDIVPASLPDLSGYRMVFIPGLFAWNERLIHALRNTAAMVVAGPRSGSKTVDFAIPPNLPPDLPSDLLDLRIGRVESLPPYAGIATRDGSGMLRHWREFVEPGPSCKTLACDEMGQPWLLCQENGHGGTIHYLAAWPDEAAMAAMVRDLASQARIETRQLPEGLRLRQAGRLLFAFNYADTAHDLRAIAAGMRFRLGGPDLPPSGVAVLEPG